MGTGAIFDGILDPVSSRCQLKWGCAAYGKVGVVSIVNAVVVVVDRNAMDKIVVSEGAGEVEEWYNRWHWYPPSFQS